MSTASLLQRISKPLHAQVSGLEVETRIRCFDDDHPPGCYNPCLDVTFCHCGRIWYPGAVALERWPDRDARLLSHVANRSGP